MSTGQLFEVGPGDVALTSDDWYTPRWLFDAAGLIFDMDVCAPVNPSMRTCPAREYLTVVEDGLVQPWHGLVWMNPPYSGTKPWVSRWVEHGDGLALMPATQGTKGSSSIGRLVGASDAIAVLAGGLEFIRPVVGYTSWQYAGILAAAGRESVEALRRIVDRYGTCAWMREKPAERMDPRPRPG